tara:strand:+ start:13827 stop:15590 length:1764 start_codon:yes stop_codon:yes gene_type:complete
MLTTYGPGSLIDFPMDAAIMGGVNHWPRKEEYRKEIVEPRLREKLATMLQLPTLRLIAPPAGESMPWEKGPRVRAFRFPGWFLAEADLDDDQQKSDVRSRRLVQRRELDGKLRFEDKRAVPVRFVQACVRGHISDVHWRRVVPCSDAACRRPLWLDESGSGGDLSDLVVRCECGARVSMAEVADRSKNMLGSCNGWRPWLGKAYSDECDQPSRLLIRTATNAYFGQTMSVLSLPQKKDNLAAAVENHWSALDAMAANRESVPIVRLLPGFSNEVESYSDDQIWSAVEAARQDGASAVPVKEAELESILDAPPGYMQDLPADRDFLARKLPDSEWREPGACDQVECVVQLHRLRVVTALTGFTRFEPRTPDIHGEYQGDVHVAALDPEPRDFPAVENRGEGVFLQLRSGSVDGWTKRPGVEARVAALVAGHERWREDRDSAMEFPGPEYILLHTLAHLLIQSVAMTCGYPATSIRERIYVEKGQYGILLYTATPDAEGTLGGLVAEARRVATHLERALSEASLCSSDPICSQHDAGNSMENRWLHGAACHGCCLVAETSCEMRNEYLDRALVIPVLGLDDAAFFQPAP